MAQFNTRIVLRNDSSANWLLNEDAILLKGEVGIEFLSDGKVMMKIGDGVKTWAQLSYFGGASETAVYEATPEGEETHIAALTRVVADATLNKGDIGIIKVLIADDKEEYTAYVYNGEEWQAMDGNYNAKNVYLDSDLTITADIGVQKLEEGEGSKTLETTGKNLKQVLDMLLAARTLPTYTEPSLTVTSPQVGEYEVGTTVTPSYTTTFNDGAYSYGPEETGVTVNSWSVTFNNETLSSESGTFAATVITDGFNKTISATANYGAGVAPYDNLGELVEDADELATCQIPADAATAATGAIKGYRNLYYTSGTTAIELTSDNLRGLSKKKSTTNSFEMSVTEGARQVIIAVPTGRKVTKVADKAAFGTDIFEKFVNNPVSVAGAAEGYDKIYNVYVYSPSTALGANTYTVSVANE